MSRFGFHMMIGIGMSALVLAAAQAAQTANNGLTSQTYKVDDGCQIVTADKKQATLADLKVGDKVDIRYHAQNGTLVADWIIVHRPRNAQQPKTSPPSGQPRPKPTNEPRARGTIININTESNIVTIEGKPPRRS